MTQKPRIHTNVGPDDKNYLVPPACPRERVSVKIVVSFKAESSEDYESIEWAIGEALRVLGRQMPEQVEGVPYALIMVNRLEEES